MKYTSLFFFCVLFFSCAETEKERIIRLVKEWKGKEVQFPDNIVYTIYGTDTVNYSISKKDYTIVTYIDSVGCTSCKLQIQRWRDYMVELDSLSQNNTSFRFIFHPKDKRELFYLLKQDKFEYPVWIDYENSFSKINSLPEEQIFHTFLLDDQNKVIAIGDPVQNPKIKELYMKIILEKEPFKENKKFKTEITVLNNVIDLKEFSWEESKKAEFVLNNTGNELFVISDVTVACGCIKVEYNKEPVRPGNNLKIVVTYKADQAERFDKSLKVYCNTNNSPLELKVKGTAVN